MWLLQSLSSLAVAVEVEQELFAAAVAKVLLEFESLAFLR